MVVSKREQMFWNRETGVISRDISVREESGVFDQLMMYEVADVQLTETEQGVQLEGMCESGTPIYAFLSAEDFVAGDKFVNHFDYKRHVEKIRESYTQAFYAPNYEEFNFWLNKYAELVTRFEKDNMLTSKDIQAIEAEVEQSCDKGMKVEQLKGFYKDILFESYAPVTQTQLEEDYSSLVVTTMIKRQLVTEAEVEQLEKEVENALVDQLRQSYRDMIFVHESNWDDSNDGQITEDEVEKSKENYLKIAEAVVNNQLLSTEGIAEIENEIKREHHMNKIEDLYLMLRNTRASDLDGTLYNQIDELEREYARVVNSTIRNEFVSKEEVVELENALVAEEWKEQERNQELLSQKIKAAYSYACSEGKGAIFKENLLDSYDESCYGMEMPLSYMKILGILEETERDFTTNQLREGIEEHGKELTKVIEEKVERDERGMSYISSQELEILLEKHFNDIETLVRTHSESQNSVTKNAKRFPDKLREIRESFANQLTTTINLTKDFADEKAMQFRENVDEVVHTAMSFIKRGILNVNAKIQTFADSVEQKFTLVNGEQDKSVESNKRKKKKMEMER